MARKDEVIAPVSRLPCLPPGTCMGFGHLPRPRLPLSPLSLWAGQHLGTMAREFGAPGPSISLHGRPACLRPAASAPAGAVD